MFRVPSKPLTEEGKECFRRYISMKEEFLNVSKKVTDARDKCENAQVYHLQLLNRGLDPEAEIFLSSKIDQGLLKKYLEIMDFYLNRISQELFSLQKDFFGRPIKSYIPFYRQESIIMRLFDIVSDAESKCMRRRQAYVDRCLKALQPTLTSLLDNIKGL